MTTLKHIGLAVVCSGIGLASLPAQSREIAELREQAQELRQAVQQLTERIDGLTRRHDFDDVFEHLEAVMASLERIGRRDLIGHVREFAQDLKERLAGRRDRGERRERDSALRILGYAKSAFLETKNERLLELVERAMHARELQAKGRRDAEARRIYERAPSLGSQAEILMHAAKLLDDFGAKEKARAARSLAERWIAALKREHNEKRGENAEIRAARHQLELYEIAREALLEAKKRDAADLVQNAANALRIAIEGRRDAEAREIREKNPSRGARAELLLYAAQFLKKAGKAEQAAALAELGKKLAR